MDRRAGVDDRAAQTLRLFGKPRNELRVGYAGHFFARGRLHELADTAGAAAERADLLRRQPVLEEIALCDARALLREELPRRVAPRSAGADV
jgi:hypothetical protein